jgi:hypothetical protein
MGYVYQGLPKPLTLKILNRIKIANLVETGTFKGETAFWAASHFENVHTIEIHEGLYNSVIQKPNKPNNVKIYKGNSIDVLSEILSKLKGQTMFWLDAHYSGPHTGGKDNECPIMEEIKIISTFSKPVIFIDDARLFQGVPPKMQDPTHWPKLDLIFEIAKKTMPNHITTIQDDIIMIVPQNIYHIIGEYWQETYPLRFKKEGLFSIKRLYKKYITPERKDNPFMVKVK